MGLTARQERLISHEKRGRRRRLRKLARVLALVGALGGLKQVVHSLDLELIPLNPLFTSLVASTVFLLGFLLNGVLADFKESEKIPGDLATSLEVLALEIQAIPAHNPNAVVLEHLEAVETMANAILAWLLEQCSTDAILDQLHRCHGVVVQAAVLLRGCATLQARLMNEMANLTRMINRIETIRCTTFVPLVYWLAYTGVSLLCGGLLFVDAKSSIEAAFFIFVIAFLLILLITLISDLDNPFAFAEAHSAEDVSLEVLLQALHRISAVVTRARAGR